MQREFFVNMIKNFLIVTFGFPILSFIFAFFAVVMTRETKCHKCGKIIKVRHGTLTEINVDSHYLDKYVCSMCSTVDHTQAAQDKV